MTNFLKLRTYGENEIYEYDPTTLGKLNSFTLSLRKFNNILFDFGQDKIHIKQVVKYGSKLEYLKEKHSDLSNLDDDEDPSHIHDEELKQGCHKKTRNYYKITVLCEHPDYQDVICIDNKNVNVIEGHGLSPGDLIYIYNTNTCNLENKIKFNLDKIQCDIKFNNNDNYNYSIELTITVLINGMNSDDKSDDDDDDICYLADDLKLNTIMKIGNIVNLKYIDNNVKKSCKYVVKGLSNDGITVKLKYINKENTDEIKSEVEIIELSYYEKNYNGVLNENKSSINYKGGVHIVDVLSKQDFIVETFENNLEDISYIQESDMFLIQHSRQLSYTFKLTTLEKDPTLLDSRLNM